MANDQLDNWSDLQEDLLCLIGRRLTTLQDVIRSRAVCKSWSQTLLAEQQCRFRPSSQWLMMPYCNNMHVTSSTPSSSISVGCKGSENCRCFYDVGEQKFHHIELPRSLDEKTCRGSAFGWLFMVQQTPCLYLLNPLTRDQILLPPITSFPPVVAYHPEQVGKEYLVRYYETDEQGMDFLPEPKEFIEKRFIRKVAMSTEPTAEECVVMVICKIGDYCLAFCKPNHGNAGEAEGWTMVPRRLFDDEENGSYKASFLGHVVFWRGQFYAVDYDGRVVVCDLSLPHQPKLSCFVNSPYVKFEGIFESDDQYLVVRPATSSTTGDVDELMLAIRYGSYPDEGEISTQHTGTVNFRLFKLDEDRKVWDEVESIGDFALFLSGFSSPAFVPTKMNPGLMPNSIYFTHDVIGFHKQGTKGGHNMGIYSLTTHTIQPLQYSTSSVHDNPLLLSPLPLWFSPSTSSSLPH